MEPARSQPSSTPLTVNGSAKQGLTFANQDSLPKLPIPELEQTCQKYLEALAPLQAPREQDETKAAVQDFLRSEGPVLQEKLKNYASSKTSYIEQFCMLSLIVIGFSWLTLVQGTIHT